MIPFKRITFELSEKCNAACPLCLRTQPHNKSKPIPEVHKKRELSVEDFKHILPPFIMNDLIEISLCGNVGDPIAAKDCLPIVQYISEYRNIQIIIETNGSLRNKKWWSDLGTAMKVNLDSVVYFHIDGLKDTNHLYRQLTNFDNIIRNAKSYIDTGAKAVWEFIPFAHNEHQIEEAKQLASSIGFDKFIIRRSNRKWTKPGDQFTFTNPAGEKSTIVAPSYENLGDGVNNTLAFMRAVNEKNKL